MHIAISKMHICIPNMYKVATLIAEKEIRRLIEIVRNRENKKISLRFLDFKKKWKTQIIAQIY